MCLTIPGEVRSLTGNDDTSRTAEVDFDGVLRAVRLLYLPDTRVGDFVMVHAGFATRRIAPEDAREAWRMARRMRGGPTPPSLDVARPAAVAAPPSRATEQLGPGGVLRAPESSRQTDSTDP